MKLGLQIVLGILSVIPLVVSILGVTQGLALRLPEEAITPQFDSQYRYIMGYYISLSLVAWWMIPQIERHRTLFRLIGGGVFFGGIGRALSWWSVGSPNPLTMFFTVLELSFPLLMIWQAKLPRRQDV
ncbi:DUF4345 domain-containing protein [filamentous cyanobacterium LEGE 11480]|uniref:DUF4345 domain-containing protein n=1 Tax=Romeriopsis navalis LEGE 11480 TaxID=2777977 RepID=A0A928VP00_9CYAN|nr:DUF4345 domain-containing protein [Romeriopsis navalis]MBE9032031.1 DUF4345 domain-containing protein [Romeriopsis navalis LEGE 11480]